MRDELSRSGGLVDGLNAAIRENPLAAGLIGAGVAWMLLGGAKGIGAVAGTVGSAAATAGGAVLAGVGEAGSRATATARDTVKNVADSVASIVPDVSAEGDNASDPFAEAGSAVRVRINSAATTGREYGSAIQSKLSDSLERQPLLLGALGLAIGAGIASTFASTALEGQWMGEKGEAVRGKLEGLTEEAKERARQVMADVKEEAYAQGLTPGAAKDAAAAMADKVKSVAGAARESVAQRLTEPSYSERQRR
jgi:hypothetical protein